VATTATTPIDEHIVGYDSYIADNWNILEHWERDAYQIWIAPSLGKAKPVKKAASQQSGEIPWTVSLAYMPLVAGLFVFPPQLQSAALALGVINLGRGNTGHGFVQVAFAVVALALFTMGHSVTWENISALQDRVRRRVVGRIVAIDLWSMHGYGAPCL
jgi:hypothetical protein